VLRQIEGSRAVAEAVAMCRPEVICAYPISPQTHIVENLSQIVKAGELAPCEFVNVESEFAAMSVAIGASATGARAYTATASQGLLYMVEALFNASGLGLPIVMTVANRAIGAPINIWNDHSDSMSQRDCGWIQLYAETNQEALDLHIQAFRLAEELSTPVMVCMDGFILTHAFERIDIPDQESVDAFLPPFTARQVLDPDDPISIGAMVGPEAFMEVKYLAHAKQMQALELIPEIAADFAAAFGRESGGLIHTYRSEDAETIVVALGSVLGTIRPFPLAALRAALGHAERVVVLEKALAVGIGGIVTANVRMALTGMVLHGYTVIAGLGGRPITKASLRELFTEASQDRLEPLTFLDMDWEIVNRELARMASSRRSGPSAENMLRDSGPVAAGPV
jgi:pyruvate ferredoxin oxidoreductase alpha subunit